MELTLEERNELRRLMNQHLNMEAVVELAEELGVDPETLAGSTKTSKVRELIGHVERHMMMEALITALVRQYPKVAWPRKTAVSQPDVDDQPVVTKPTDGCDITAVSDHLSPIRTLDFMQKAALVDHLLKTTSMSDSQKRQAIVAQLPDDIRFNLQTGPDARVDTINIIGKCLDYERGLAVLISIIHFFEGKSLPMRDLCQFVLTLKNTGQ